MKPESEIVKDGTKPPEPATSRSTAGLGDETAIREIHAHLLEKHDVGWTELAVMTAKEYANTMVVPMIPGVSITQCWTNEKCDMLQGPCACGAWHHLTDWSAST